MARFGSSIGYTSDSLSATTDPQGNPIVSSDDSFAASPLGVAARAQALSGIPNPTFNLTPPDSLGTISSANQIPYWDLFNDGDIIPTMSFDSATETWDVDLNPSGAGSGANLTLRTRSYLLNDTNLALRQKAFLTITKNGSFSGTAQWELTLGAEYYTSAGVSLGSFTIGTVSHSATWTSISGTTTSGGTAIDPSAYYADLSVTLTALGTVTDTTTVRLNSLLLATSEAATGSFLITENFLASGTFTRPTGVDFVTVVAVGGGKGGDSGELTATNLTTTGVVGGGRGGNSGQWALVRDIALGTATTVAIGVGAGGTGGTANSFSKGTSSSTLSDQNQRVGTGGGASSFGSFLSVPGGAVTAGTVTFGFFSVGGGTVNQSGGGAPNPSTQAAKDGDSSIISASTLGAPFTTFVAIGAAGVAGTGSGGGSGTASLGGTAQALAGIIGGGGGGGQGTASSSSNVFLGGVGGAGGAASAGGAAMRFFTANAQTIVVTGGAGGTAVENSGSGGGGGGAVGIASNSTGNYLNSSLTANSGAGGDGATGFVTVAYIA